MPSDTHSVIVATFGDLIEWTPLANRALESARAQTITPHEIIRIHGASLHEARNSGLRQATGEWAIFLDADDLLETHYIERSALGHGDLRQPLTSTITWSEPPVTTPPKRLLRGMSLIYTNWIVIGAPVRRQLLLDVGGFDDWPMLEDWEAWIRIEKAGGVIGECESEYIISNRPGSRNKQSALANEVHAAIRRKHPF